MIQRLSFEVSTLTRINSYGQTLLHLWQTSWSKYYASRPNRHIAENVATRAPFGTERTAALYRGTIYTKA